MSIDAVESARRVLDACWGSLGWTLQAQDATGPVEFWARKGDVKVVAHGATMGEAILNAAVHTLRADRFRGLFRLEGGVFVPQEAARPTPTPTPAPEGAQGARGTLLLLVGLPRSGKSTWARGRGCPIVCPDSIRLALHGQRFVAEAEPTVWATARLMVRALFESGHPEVALDATSLTPERRREWRSEHWEVRAVEFRVPAEECIRRAKEGGRLDLVTVIERMSRQLRWVEPHEKIPAEEARSSDHAVRLSGSWTEAGQALDLAGSAVGTAPVWMGLAQGDGDPGAQVVS